MNVEGFKNRYRDRVNYFPHCDLSYTVIYPEKDNDDYVSDPNAVYRRCNVAMSRYEARSKVNGSVDLKVLLDVLPSDPAQLEQLDMQNTDA